MKILVVLTEKHRKLGAEGLLLRKAVMLAKGLGASLELFHCVHDRSLELSMFVKRDRQAAAQEAMLASAREWVGNLAESLQARGLSAHYEVSWGRPNADSIIKKIRDDGFTWVLKEPDDERAFFGLSTNVDWNLLRHSPASVYFVKGAAPPGAGVLVALEGFTAEVDDAIAVLDYDIFRNGRRIAESFDTPLTVVHAFSVPPGIPAYVGYSPLMSDAPVSPKVVESLNEAERRERRTVAEKHGRAIKAFAEYFAYPVADIVIREGSPDLVISDEARRRQSGLVVMGAGEAGLFDRLFRSGTSEPTLEEAECDILFVKPELPAELALESSLAESKVLSEILHNPTLVFDSPDAVVEDKRFGIYDKRRILRAWEQKILHLLAVNHNRLVRIETPEFEAVRAAQRALRHKTA